MALFCTECAQRVYTRKGCPRDPMAAIERIPPLDGYAWFGEAPAEQPFSRGKKRKDPLDLKRTFTVR